jgi:acyl-CoA thioester hydrolase
LERQGVLLPVIEAFATYKKSAAYDDEIVVESIVREVPVARIRIEYVVYRSGEPEPLVEGYTVHSFLNAATGRPTRAPAQLVQLLQEAMQ